MKKNINSTAGKFTVFQQVCKLIPAHLVASLVAKHKSGSHARTFSHWSHIVALIFGKLTHCFGLNDICDALQLNTGPLSAVRGATAPTRNTLSHANRVRPASIAEDLFWKTLESLRQNAPGFGRRRFPGKLRKLKASIQLLDSTVIELVANCMDWAAHRRRKAAAKCHVRLDFETLLPSFVVLGPGREHDNVRAREAAASLKKGQILVADRAYVDFEHFADLEERGVFWVTRMKERMTYKVLSRAKVSGKILADDLIELSNGLCARRIHALVEVDGVEREMTFLTNNFA